MDQFLANINPNEYFWDMSLTTHNDQGNNGYKANFRRDADGILSVYSIPNGDIKNGLLEIVVTFTKIPRSSGGDDRWSATEIMGTITNGTMVLDGAFNFVERSKIGRFLANGYQHISKAELAQTLKLAKPLTRGIAGINLISQTISVADDFSHGRWRSGTTRGVVNGIILGVTAVNPLFGFGLGVAEALWGDYFYEYVEKNWWQ